MSQSSPLVFSVTSGKGGVGKTNIAVNLACRLAGRGHRVVLLDADLGLANVDVMLGLTPPLNLFHLFTEKASLKEILFPTPYGFSILPAASGVDKMIALDTGQKLELLEAMDVLENKLDYLIVDTGAGIADNVLYFNLAVQERIVVLTPEPTSLTDAYALIKVMKLEHDVERFKVLVNMAPDTATAKQTYKRLHEACDHFLSGVSLDLLGFAPRDHVVRDAIMAQKPLVEYAPTSPAAKSITAAASTIENWEVTAKLDGNIKFFWKNLLFRPG